MHKCVFIVLWNVQKKTRTRTNTSSAAPTVLKKFTSSLFSTLRLSSHPPNKLSNNMPNAPEIHTASAVVREISPTRTQTAAITNAATTPADVPARVMPPSVPAGTDFQFVISRALLLTACPHSLETVSAAASAKAADITARITGTWKVANTPAAKAATPRFARTCEAVRPPVFSAVPSARLRAYPNRVAMVASRKTAISAAKAPGPAAKYKMKLTTAPAIAPDRVTVRSRRAARVKARVTTAAVPARIKTAADHDAKQSIVAKCCDHEQHTGGLAVVEPCNGTTKCWGALSLATGNRDLCVRYLPSGCASK